MVKTHFLTLNCHGPTRSKSDCYFQNSKISPIVQPCWLKAILFSSIVILQSNKCPVLSPWMLNMYLCDNLEIQKTDNKKIAVFAGGCDQVEDSTFT